MERSSWATWIAAAKKCLANSLAVFIFIMLGRWGLKSPTISRIYSRAISEFLKSHITIIICVEKDFHWSWSLPCLSPFGVCLIIVRHFSMISTSSGPREEVIPHDLPSTTIINTPAFSRLLVLSIACADCRIVSQDSLSGIIYDTISNACSYDTIEQIETPVPWANPISTGGFDNVLALRKQVTLAKTNLYLVPLVCIFLH